MSFIIEINGNEITSIEDLKENFDIDALLTHRTNFDEWLFGWDYEDEAAQVRELSPDLSDDDWLEKICNILGVSLATLTTAKSKREEDRKKAEAAAAAMAEAEAKKKQMQDFLMPIDDAILVFARGFCCIGRVKQGKIKIGDIVNICDKSEKILTSAKILEINQYGKTREIANTGDIVAICLPGTDELYRVFAGREGKEFILKI